MPRLSKFLLLILLVVFILACNTVTKPITDVQNVASTVESVASALPIETIQAVSSALPDIGNMFNPQGEPASEWNGIPVMSQATAGQEFADTKTYSFKADATVKEAQDFYNDAMGKAGWSPMISMPSDANGAILVFQKDGKAATITITSQDNAIVVLLTLP